jgi:hypothetical protein
VFADEAFYLEEQREEGREVDQCQSAQPQPAREQHSARSMVGGENPAHRIGRPFHCVWLEIVAEHFSCVPLAFFRDFDGAVT